MNTQNVIVSILMKAYLNGQSLHCHFCDTELGALANHCSEDVRAWLAKALVNHNNEHTAVSLLAKLSKDEEQLVRLEATDSLSAFANQESFCALLAMMYDKCELVRAYAAFGIAVVGRELFPQKATQILLDVANTETNKRVLVDTYEGLYILGFDSYLKKLMSLFGEDDYQIQIAVLHALEEVKNSSNHQDITQFLWGLETKDRVRAVLDAIWQLRNTCQVADE